MRLVASAIKFLRAHVKRVEQGKAAKPEQVQGAEEVIRVVRRLGGVGNSTPRVLADLRWHGPHLGRALATFAARFQAPLLAAQLVIDMRSA